MKEKFITIPRVKANSNNDPPCWTLTDIDDPDVWYKPLIFCRCGELTSIGNHTVHKDGRVTASYFHTHGKQPCGWHVHIKLENWIGIEFPPQVLTQPKK